MCVCTVIRFAATLRRGISMRDVLYDSITARVMLFFTANCRGLFIPHRLGPREKKDAELTLNRRNVEKSSRAFAGHEADYLREDESYYDEPRRS